MKLLRIFSVIEKHYPEVATQLIRNYCTEADAPESERTGQFNLGYNSLKWALCAVNEINPDAVKNLFRDILFEFYARQLPIQQLEVNILTFSAMYPYKAQLKQRNTIDVTELPGEVIGNLKFIINNTNKNLTSVIMQKTSADAVVFHNPDTKASGIIFRIHSKLNIYMGFKHYLIDSLDKIEEGWMALGNDLNLIINHGNSSVTPDQIIKIIKNYNW